MCLICDRIKMSKEKRNPYFVKELCSGYVYHNEARPTENELSELKYKLSIALDYVLEK